MFLSGSCDLAVVTTVALMVLCVVFVWETSSLSNRIEDIELRLATYEKDLKAIHNSIGKFNKELEKAKNAKFVGHWEIDS